MLPVQREEAPENWFLQAGGEKSAKNRDSATELPTTVGQLERWRSTFRKQALNSLTESRRSVCEMIFSFSLDILEIPTMLFFFLQATMSFLRANTSQLSCRKHVEAKKMCIIYIIHSQTLLQILFNAWCVGILLAQLWRAQPSLTCRGWSWTRFLWSHLWIPLWSLDEHRWFCLFSIIFSLCSQNMTFLSNREGRHRKGLTKLPQGINHIMQMHPEPECP